VIDVHYENPLYVAEDAGAADIIAGGRLALRISWGSPEQVIDGWRDFGLVETVPSVLVPSTAAPSSGAPS
jgi:alkanesulfonate monooxygenase SsuD/methylene tetrahydromethanopterin reductase-like flavin-dependent oxidoreductase (luciferase family)